MIEHVTITGLGVIDRAELEPAPGFTVVTGETGAGKTMVVTALGLLLGARAEASAVRAEAAKATVDAEIDVPADHPARRFAAEAAGAEEHAAADEPLLIGRSVSAKGRSRAAAAGRPVPVSVLAEIGAQLVTVHGQSDQLRLKSSAAQRSALDSYSGTEFLRLLGDYQRDFDKYQSISAELEEITAHEVERRREAEQLQQALEAIDTVDPQPGEDEELRAESLKLENVEGLREAARTAQEALSGADAADAAEPGPNAAELVESSLTALAAVSDQDAELAETSQQIREVSTLLSDAASQLGVYAAGLDESGPERLAEVHHRRAEIERLQRLYGPDVADVLHWAEESRSRLTTLSSDADRIDELSTTLEQLRGQLHQQAAELTRRRTASAETLSRAVSQELTELSMPHARLHVDVRSHDELTRYGTDAVEILLQPHTGAQPLPLSKGASGGELSRVMLALEVVLAEQATAETFIFDEVDAGVGGKAAVQIGRRLAKLARHSQVIVVTHLPQVAAYADQHIRVHKSSDASAGVTASDVGPLGRAERVEELARMLAGQEESDAARAHADELLAAAAGEKT